MECKTLNSILLNKSVVAEDFLAYGYFLRFLHIEDLVRELPNEERSIA